MGAPAPRKGMPSPKLGEVEFKRRYREQFFDPAFQSRDADIDELAEIAWRAYSDSRKSPITRKAGPEFAHPDYDMSVDWLSARGGPDCPEKLRGRNAASAYSRRSLRSEHTCPGETSKSYRLAEIARATRRPPV